MTNSSRKGWWSANRKIAEKAVRRPSQFNRSRRSHAAVEALEARVVLNSNMTISAANQLAWVGSVVVNDLTVSFSAGTYTFNDPSEFINVANSGTGTVTGSGTNTVTVTQVAGLKLDGGGGNDTINLQSINDPTAVTDSAISTIDNLNVGNAGNMQGIVGALTIDNPGGFYNVTLDDSADATARTVAVTPSQVTGLSPGPINYTAGNLQNLTIQGGSGGNTFTVDAPGILGGTILNSGAGDDTINVQSTSGLGGPLFIGAQGGNNAVNLTNLENIAGPVHVTGLPTSVALSLNDSADSGGDNASLAAAAGLATLTGLSAAPISYTTTALSGVNITAGSGNDSLSVDFSGQNPIPGDNGLTFDGGSGSNTLNLAGGTFTNEVYSAFGPGAGNIDLDSSHIGFTNLRPVNDTVTATNYTFNGPFNANSINVGAGPLIGGTTQTLQIASTDTPPGFELANIANKTHVTVSAGGPFTGNSVVLNYNSATPVTGLATLVVNSGTSADFVNVLATPPNVATSVNTQAGNDVLDLSVAGLGAGGSTSLDGGAGFDILNIDAANKGPVVVTPTTITIGTSVINYANFESIHISNAADQPLTGAGTTIAVTEGAPINDAVVATFTDADPSGKAGDFVASINWGDGTPITAGTVLANGTAGFNVLGSHTYTEKGTFTVTTTITDKGSSGTITVGGIPVTISDAGGQTTAPVSTATVTDSALSGQAFPVISTEGALLTNIPIATFSDAAGADPVVNYTVTVNWGDGTPTTPGTVTANGANFNVTGSHNYTEEGSFPVTVTISDEDGSSIILGTSAHVADAKLTASAATALTGIEGTAVSGGIVSFTDANPSATVGDFTATINWGDGIVTAGTVVANNGGGFNVNGSHVYEEGSFPILVTINDVGGSTTSASQTATIADAALTAGPALAIKATEGQKFGAQVATFTDANPHGTVTDFTATITWGDGSTSPGIIRQDASKAFSVLGIHTYAEEGSFPVSVTINDVGGSTTTSSTTATVADARLIAAGLPVAAVEGTSFSGPVAIFGDTDPGGTLSDYAATINWGDGTTSSGTVAVNGTSGFVVNGTHTYAEEGAFPVSVTINDSGGSSIGAFGTARVGDAPPNSTSPIHFTVTEGHKFSGPVAAFSEIYGSVPISEPAGDFRAFIDWGDGTPVTQGTVVTEPGGLQVTGIHTYVDSEVDINTGTPSKDFPVTVTIIDDGGTFVRVASTATVNDVAINLTGQLNPASDSGQSHFDAITNVAQPNFYGFSEPFSVVTLSASPTAAPGLFQIGSTMADASGFWSITSAHLADGSYTIIASATDATHHTTAETQILPNAAQGPLVIDTVGPKITDVTFDRIHGQVFITFQDDRSGLDQESLIDGANYAFDKANQKPGQFLITALTATSAANPTSPQTVDASINFGQALRGGRYTLTVHSLNSQNNGIRDVAGNRLDGEFYGFFPSGNNIVGGDFVALIDTVHNTIFAPGPVHAFATPNVPPGRRPGKTTVIPSPTPPTTTSQLAQGTAQAQAALNVHDMVLSEFGINKKSKLHG
jgi:hypothetical protein